MDKKAFSLIEIIFVILIIAVVVTTAVSKFGVAFDKTNITKIKADILQIRAGINSYTNKMILKNQNHTLDSLDDNNEKLFNIVLNSPIIASSEKAIGNWSKISTNQYQVYLNTKNVIQFQYNNIEKTFDCDITNTFCKELNL